MLKIIFPVTGRKKYCLIQYTEKILPGSAAELVAGAGAFSMGSLYKTIRASEKRNHEFIHKGRTVGSDYKSHRRRQAVSGGGAAQCAGSGI